MSCTRYLKLNLQPFGQSMKTSLSVGVEKKTRERPLNTRGGAYPWCSLSWSDRGSCFQGPTTSTPFITPPSLSLSPLHLQHGQWETSRDQRSKVEKSGGSFYCLSPRNKNGSVCMCAHTCVWERTCVCVCVSGKKKQKVTICIYEYLNECVQINLRNLAIGVFVQYVQCE